MEQLDRNDDSLGVLENNFELITKKTIWQARLGKYIIEIIKVTLKVLTKRIKYNQKCTLYYILDMIHLSFESAKEVRDDFFMEQIKSKCQEHKNCTQFIRHILDLMIKNESEFRVERLVDISYYEYMDQIKDEELEGLMQDLKLLYFCVGPNFLLTQIKPVLYEQSIIKTVN